LTPQLGDGITIGGPAIFSDDAEATEVLVWLTRDRPMTMTL